MMNRKYKVAVMFSILSFLGASSAIAETDFSADLESDRLVQRKVGSPEDYFQYVVYNRKSYKTFSSNPDYFYMWNGDKQTLPEFMNLTGLILNNKGANKRNAVFIGAVTNGEWKDSVKERNSLSYIAKMYQRIKDDRREISVGYDLGVAEAFRFACEKKVDAVVLSQGGLYTDEYCSPKKMDVLYSVNIGAQRYPMDATADFDFRGRDSGYNTKDKLVSLLKCNKSPIESKSATGVELKYNCGDGNKLVVLEHKMSVHQWNGYVNTPEGFSNMQGESVPYPLLNWLKSELHVE